LRYILQAEQRKGVVKKSRTAKAAPQQVPIGKMHSTLAFPAASAVIILILLSLN
jgi:hypothetical protein